MSHFNPGDRVKHIFTGAEMTVTGPGYFGDEIEVRTGNGSKEYVDPFLVEPIDGKENDRGALAKEHTTVSTEIPSEKESVMHNVINIPQAPAGFKREYFCTCGMGCTPDDLNTEDNCEIEGSVYAGPDVHLTDSTGTQVNSHWSPRNGITFDVSNYGFDSTADDAEYVAKAWTREQLEALPEMVEKVLANIDQAPAVEVMTAHPVPRANPEYHT
ncbi:hypothetical protein ACTXM3_18025, partial [Glutamicibacter arilaitensis]